MNRLFDNLSTVSELSIDKMFPFEFEYFILAIINNIRNILKLEIKCEYSVTFLDIFISLDIQNNKIVKIIKYT